MIEVFGYRDNTTYSNGKTLSGLYQIDQIHFNAVIRSGSDTILMKADLAMMSVSYTSVLPSLTSPTLASFKTATQFYLGSY